MHFCTHLQTKGMPAKCSDSNSCKSTVVYKDICNVYECDASDLTKLRFLLYF